MWSMRTIIFFPLVFIDMISSLPRPCSISNHPLSSLHIFFSASYIFGQPGMKTSKPENMSVIGIYLYIRTWSNRTHWTRSQKNYMKKIKVKKIEKMAAAV